MKGIFGGLFDYNIDGIMSSFETAAELMFIDDMHSHDSVQSALDDSFMDVDEKEAWLEENGYDPWDFNI